MKKTKNTDSTRNGATVQYNPYNNFLLAYSW